MGVKKERAARRENFVKKFHCGGLLEGKGASRERILFLCFFKFLFLKRQELLELVCILMGKVL